MKVMVAVDGSRCSDAAVDSIIRKMPPDSTEVRVLHVVEKTPQSESLSHGREVAGQSERSLRTAGFKVDAVVEEGDPKVVIVDSAERWNADLIVVGCHGRNSLHRLLLGSVAESVARHSGCSVEIVRSSRV